MTLPLIGIDHFSMAFHIAKNTDLPAGRFHYRIFSREFKELRQKIIYNSTEWNMNITLNSKTKLILTAVITFLILGMLLLEHFRGGVISHHLLANEDLPKISNWWGILTIPVISWFSLSNLQKRNLRNKNEQTPISKSQLYGFIGAFLFGIIMTILFYSSLEIHKYLLLFTFTLALFIPIYRPEYYLGFILSMAYGFGGVLPVIFGFFLIVIYAIEYNLIRRGFLYILSRIKL